MLEFRTTHVYRPADRGTGTDQRDLGFALVLMTSMEFVQPELVRRREQALQPLVGSVLAVDRWAKKVRPRWRHPSAPHPDKILRPGLSILIPERDNRQELADCLGSVQVAGRQWAEPLETIVVVSGSPQSGYRHCERRIRGFAGYFARGRWTSPVRCAPACARRVTIGSTC